MVRIHRAAVLALALFGASTPGRAATCVATSAAPLAIAAQTAGSTLVLSGLEGVAGAVEVRLTDLAAPEFLGLGVEDLDLLLVSPAGQRILLMSNACAAEFGPIDLVFSKSGATVIPSAVDPPGPSEPTPCVNAATYKSGDWSGGVYGLEAPAPAPPYSTNLATIEGSAPNGGWTLYAAAATAGSIGSLAAWELRVVATACSGGPAAQWPVSVATAGSGGGVVTSSPGGIACPGDCGGSFDHGSTVTLTASPTPPSTFAAWGGDCAGSGVACELVVTAARSATATFAPPPPQALSLDAVGVGLGTVTSSPAGIACPGDCSESWAWGTAVTLTAHVAVGGRFVGWSGDCAGTELACPLVLTSPRIVTATFEAYLPPNAIFANGFELGTACAWSAQAGSADACG